MPTPIPALPKVTATSTSLGPMTTPVRRITLIQGEQHVDSDPAICLTTLLGSCIAACLWDPVTVIGGMNHFLLPGGRSGEVEATDGDAMRYGAYAMELLINALLRRGAQRARLRAKLFGGACMMCGLTDIGHLNASFAERFLHDEGIAVVGGSLRGDRGRRIEFWPVSGRARQTLLRERSNEAVQRHDLATPRTPSAATGALELF